jgi:hypothetical protein
MSFFVILPGLAKEPGDEIRPTLDTPDPVPGSDLDVAAELNNLCTLRPWEPTSGQAHVFGDPFSR